MKPTRIEEILSTLQQLDSESKIRSLTEDLVRIYSESPSKGEETGETDISLKISEFLKETPVKFLTSDSNYQDVARIRENVSNGYFLLEGESKETIVLIGHTDTVGIKSYGNISDLTGEVNLLDQDIALNPILARKAALEKILTENPQIHQKLSEERFLFGRGCFDMKSGLAAEAFVMKYFSSNPKELNGKNLIMIATPDEENSSQGIIKALDFIKRVEGEGFQIKGIINTDYSPQERDEHTSTVFTGTTGKMLVGVFVRGKEGHVGESYNLLNPINLIARITDEVTFAEYKGVDNVEGESAQPINCLSLKDGKTSYNVQTPVDAWAYYNVAIHGRSVEDILNFFKDNSVSSFKETLFKISSSYVAHLMREGLSHEEAEKKAKEKISWEPKVILYDQLRREVESDYVQKNLISREVKLSELELKKELYRTIKDKVTKKMDAVTADSRDVAKFYIESLLELSPDKSPQVVISTLEPFYAAGYSKEGRVFQAVIETLREANDSSLGLNFEQKFIYPPISDISYLLVDDNSRIQLRDLVAKNLPNWASPDEPQPSDKIIHYTLPIDKLGKYEIVNLGTRGGDAHMNTEHVDIKYGGTILPALLIRVIENINGCDKNE